MIAFAFLFMGVFPHTSSPIAAQSEPEIKPNTRFSSRLWVVQVADGADPQAVASASGMQYLAPVGSLPGYHLFRLAEDDDLSPAQANASLKDQPLVLDAVRQVGFPITFSQLTPDDPDFPDSWHLENTGQDSHGVGPGVVDQDIDVQAAWDADNNPMTAGLSGLGVIVAAIDDGIETTHPDLSAHYRADLDFDYVDFDDDGAAVPGFGDEHGTAVSGIMAAALDNGKCSAGIAYNAELASVRMLSYSSGTGPLIGYDGSVSSSFSHRVDEIDVFNNSWGWNPILSFNNELPLSGKALEYGIKNGRGGRGSIYVFAAGNNNARSTNHDPNASTRYTIVVGGSGNTGQVVWYSTRGPGVFVSAPTMGGAYGGYDNGIYTTDMTGDFGYSYGSDTNVAGGDLDCTSEFGGTSAASPIVSGVVALMLEANPNLTWRDVKHILAETSDKIDLGATGAEKWQTNDAGLQFSHAYGFGRVNAGAATDAAETWTTVPPEHTVENAVVTVNLPIPDGNNTGLTSTHVVEAGDLPDGFVVEHVVVEVDMPHQAAGQLKATLTSPSGVVSQLLRESNTYTFSGLINDFPLLTVANWGEDKGDLDGTWSFNIQDRYAVATGRLNDWQLVFYGYIDSALIAPSNLVASVESETSINLNWFDNATTETGYRIERTTDPAATWDDVTTVAANTATFTDTALTPCTRYFYRVIALNGGAESSPSNTANARPKDAGGCSSGTFTLLRPGPGSRVVEEPEIAFSNPGNLNAFQVQVFGKGDTTVFEKTVKANKLADYCTASLCSVDLTSLPTPPIFKNGQYSVLVKTTATDDSKAKSKRHTFAMRSPGQPTLLTPPNYTVLFDPAQLSVFEWGHLETATGYLLKITERGSGKEIFETKLNQQAIQTSCVSQTCSVPFPAEALAKVDNQKYYLWTVKAKNVRGSVGSFLGNFYSAFVDGAVLVEPEFYAQYTDADQVKFVWQPVEDVTNYQLNLWTRVKNKLKPVLSMKFSATTAPSLDDVCDDVTELCTYIPTAEQLDKFKQQFYVWDVLTRVGPYKAASQSSPFYVIKEGQGGGKRIVMNQTPVPNGQTAPSPLFGWSVSKLGGQHTLTVSGGDTFVVYTFDSDAICTPEPNLEGIYSCIVDFNNLPGTGGTEVLPSGVYEWFVSVKETGKPVTSDTTTFTVIEQAPIMLRQP